uniref:F-box/LRR-repeat protein 15/At3g58940/PEG3-like LRR domain-containing protein n=1 Tax=Aegilops tauschii TaxID=37682 RepID=M8C3X9_AEGTA
MTHSLGPPTRDLPVLTPTPGAAIALALSFSLARHSDASSSRQITFAFFRQSPLVSVSTVVSERRIIPRRSASSGSTGMERARCRDKSGFVVAATRCRSRRAAFASDSGMRMRTRATGTSTNAARAVPEPKGNGPPYSRSGAEELAMEATELEFPPQLNTSIISQQPEEEDRLSMLTDDILLSILGRIDLRTAARMSALSTRWRCLPWLLPELRIDAKNFLSVPPPKPIEEKDMDEAMASLTTATRSFLVNRHAESSISTLKLKIYLIKNFLCEIGQLRNSGEEDMQQRARQIDGFFSAYPIVLHCLTRLSLYNVRIDKLDAHHLLFDCCKQLEHLSLFWCDTGAGSLFKIDAPNSKLRVLKIINCAFERLELVCLPKLEKFIWDNWLPYCVPWAAFGFVPLLGELVLSRDAVWEHTCDVEDNFRQQYTERRTPQWKMHIDGSKNLLLKELEFTGFRSLEHQFTFIRAMLERAPNLQLVVLNGDEQCDDCDALDTPQCPSKFPKKDEREMVVRRIQDGKFSPQIVFDE